VDVFATGIGLANGTTSVSRSGKIKEPTTTAPKNLLIISSLWE
jgi:hypothetical protein